MNSHKVGTQVSVQHQVETNYDKYINSPIMSEFKNVTVYDLFSHVNIDPVKKDIRYANAT